MSKDETIQDILERTVAKWLKSGEIVRESAAFLHAERRAPGKITRGAFRAYYEGKRVPRQERVFEGLAELTGVSQTRLVAAAQRGAPNAEDREELASRVEYLELELENLLNQARAEQREHEGQSQEKRRRGHE